MEAWQSYDSDSRLFAFDYRLWEEIRIDLDHVSSGTVTAEPTGLTLGTPTVVDTQVRVRVSGGTPATVYQLCCKATLASGSILTAAKQLLVLEC